MNLDGIEMRGVRELDDGQCVAYFVLPGPISDDNARAIHGTPNESGLVSDLAKSGQLIESFVGYPRVYEAAGLTDAPQGWWFGIRIDKATYLALTANRPGDYSLTKTMSYHVPPTAITKATASMTDQLGPQELFDLATKATRDGNRELADHFYQAYRAAPRNVDIGKALPEREQTVAEYVVEIVKARAEIEALHPRSAGKDETQLMMEIFDSAEGRPLYQLQSSYEYGHLPVSALKSRVEKSKGELSGIEQCLRTLADWDRDLSD